MNTTVAYESVRKQGVADCIRFFDRMEETVEKRGVSLFRSLGRSERKPQVDTAETDRIPDVELLFRISLEYRVLYYFKPFSQESFLSYKGACWCSRERLGSFPYGPGPDDPSLRGGVVRDFFRLHREFVEQVKPSGRRLDWETETALNRHCMILGQFELLMHRGLFACRDLPLFSKPNATAGSLLHQLDEDWVGRMTYLSYCFHSDYKNVDVDIRGLVQQKKNLPRQSPLRQV